MGWEGTGWIYSGDYLYNNSSTNDQRYLRNRNSTQGINNYSSEKTYLYRTRIKNIDQLIYFLFPLNQNNFEIISPWGQSLRPTTNSNFDFNGDDGYLYFYSKPGSNLTSRNNIFYGANQNFDDGFGIFDFEVFELNWFINGYSYISSLDINSEKTNPDFNKRSSGLAYMGGNNYSFFMEEGDFDPKSNKRPIIPNSQLHDIISGPGTGNPNNWVVYLSTYVSYPEFNLAFDYIAEKTLDAPDTLLNLPEGITVYLSKQQPPNIGRKNNTWTNWLNNSQELAFISSTQSTPIESIFFGLEGNSYVVITVDNLEQTEDTIIHIENLRIEGGYHPGNNRQYELDTSLSPIDLTGATYTALVGNGNTINATSSLVINPINAKIGNGIFKSGIWENGVWNNGWRFDDGVKEFINIDSYFTTQSDVRWTVKIVGKNESVSSFNIGDKVSIGNIVAIDINENRNLITDYFTILDVKENGIDNRLGYILVELRTNFPIRRIERDSENHRINITKNVWLNGTFLNGYFKGNWNNGLFKGFPLITEMFNSNWIDGTFDGGHFKSEYYISGTFSDTFFNNGLLGLEFESDHKLEKGDIVNITMDDENINRSYNGESTVLEIIDDKKIVVNKRFGLNIENESGSYTTEFSTGLIQNFNFKSNNLSTITSIDSMNSFAIFSYDSWIDTTYVDTTAVNIGKPNSIINEFTGKSISENNLYGWPTNDVLSSVSEFRDSYSLDRRTYRLGKKYKIFSDYIGDSSRFEEYFNPNSQEFLNLGWEFKEESLSSIVFSRTIDSGDDFIEGEELKVEVSNGGGVLDIGEPSSIINNRDNSPIEKNRYTVVEFDLIDYDVPSITSATTSPLTEDDLEYLRIESIRNENKIEIGNKNTSNKLYQPITQKWKRHLAEFIYLKNEVQTKEFPSFYKGNKLGGEIKSISFYKWDKDSNSDPFENVKVYFGLTTSNSFTSPLIESWDSVNTYLQENNYTLVYNGNVNNESSVNSWVEINLDNPFEYEREQNLMVLIYQEFQNEKTSTKFSNTNTGQNISRFYPNPLSNSTNWNEFFQLDINSLTPGTGYIDGEILGVSGGSGTDLTLSVSASPLGAVLELKPISLSGNIIDSISYTFNDDNNIISDVNSISLILSTASGTGSSGPTGSGIMIDYLLNNETGFIDSLETSFGKVPLISISNPGLFYKEGDVLQIPIFDEFEVGNSGSCIGTFSDINGDPVDSRSFNNLKGLSIVSSPINAFGGPKPIYSIVLPVDDLIKNDKDIFELNDCNPQTFGDISYYIPNKFGVDDIEVVFDYDITLSGNAKLFSDIMGGGGGPPDKDKIWIEFAIMERLNTNDNTNIGGFDGNNGPITDGSSSKRIKRGFYPIDLVNSPANLTGTGSVYIEDFEYEHGKSYFFTLAISKFEMRQDTASEQPTGVDVIAEFGGPNTLVRNIPKPQSLHVSKVTQGNVNSVSVVNAGSEYQQGDVVTLDSGDSNSTIRIAYAPTFNLNTELSTWRPDIKFKIDILQGLSQYTTPILHFDNINLTNRETLSPDGDLVLTKVPSTYLPIVDNINHLLTPKRKKVEYFFNKRNLSMNFKGAGLNGINSTEFVIDNLHYYEVDMIPFFKYFTEENINFGIKLPFEMESTYVEFDSNDLNFINL